MHGNLQPGDRSPKQVNAMASTSQLKPGCDSVQNSGTSFPSQGKGKKRERDLGADPAKREKLSKTDDGDSGKCRLVASLKSEIARITEKGGVIGLDGVEKLVQLMQSDRNKDLMSRYMLTSVMAATDKTDCLNQFVQLRGLSVLDEWLQDIRKGKIGDGKSPKEGDKSVEEFLLVLLCALEKLPVNLHALQTCYIGRSVNHLRSHKNLEIQRKARSLVEMWKKRVEAEMISIDSKSGSAQANTVWPSKSRSPDASQGGSRTLSGSEVAMKSPLTQNSASKTTSGRLSNGESTVKSASLSPGKLKSVSSSGSSEKENQLKMGTVVGANSDVSMNREDRGSSSNQSNSCGQLLSGKDDVKGSSAGLITVNKNTSSTIRTQRNNGTHTVPVIESQKESSSSRISSVHESIALEKLQTSSNSERSPDGPVSEGSNHKLVKISNRLRNPEHGISAESVEDPTFMSSRGSSPVLLDKVSKVSCEDVGSPTANPEEEPSSTNDDSRLIEGLPENKLKSSILQSSLFSPMNALVESCAKYSEANSSLSHEDDVGMNLLASVAAGEISRFDLISPTDSTERSNPAIEENCVVDEAKSQLSIVNCSSVLQSRSCVGNEIDDKKQAAMDGNLPSDDGSNMLKVPQKYSNEKECAVFQNSDDKLVGEDSVLMESRLSTSTKCDTNEMTSTTALSMPISSGKLKDGMPIEKNHMEVVDRIDTKGNDLFTEEKSGTVVGAAASIVEIAGSDQLGEVNVKESNEELDMVVNLVQKEADIGEAEFSEFMNREKIHRTECSRNLVSETNAESNLGKPEEKYAESCTTESPRCNFDKEVGRNLVTEIQSIATSTDVKCDTEEIVEKKLVVDRGSIVDNEAEVKRYVAASIQVDEVENHSRGSENEATTSGGQNDTNAKNKFDLNEGFSADDVKFGESSNLVSSVSVPVQMLNSVPISACPAPTGQFASITVAAAAKGAFVPPDDLARSKGETGWKGAAATSAFRPAEPRKFFDATNSPCSDASHGKRDRIPLDIDLNVPDERVLEEIASREFAFTADSTDFVSNCSTSLTESVGCLQIPGSGGLDLDLNRADEANDNSHCSSSSYHKGVGSAARSKPTSFFPSGDIRRDFDLNDDGPAVDYSISEHFSASKQVKHGMPSHLPPIGQRMSSPGVGNFSSWFPPGNAASTVSVPTILSDRGDRPFPVFPNGPPQRSFGPIGATPLAPDVRRGSVLSSSPAVPFSSSSFQYPVFPFGSTFPLPSGTFSAVSNTYADSSMGARLFAPPLNSPFLGPFGSAAPQFHRPYIVNIPENANGVLENNRKWGRKGLDLNAGPVAIENEAREEMFAQHPVANSQSAAEDQTWMYSVPGGILKRKDPEGGWDGENFRYKQFSWQ